MGRIIARIQQRNQSSIIVSFRSLLRPRVTNATLLSKNIPIPILSLLLLLFGVNQAEKIIQKAIALSLKVFADFQHVFYANCKKIKVTEVPDLLIYYPISHHSRYKYETDNIEVSCSSTALLCLVYRSGNKSSTQQVPLYQSAQQQHKILTPRKFCNKRTLNKSSSLAFTLRPCNEICPPIVHCVTQGPFHPLSFFSELQC